MCGTVSDGIVIVWNSYCMERKIVSFWFWSWFPVHSTQNRMMRTECSSVQALADSQGNDAPLFSEQLLVGLLLFLSNFEKY